MPCDMNYETTGFTCGCNDVGDGDAKMFIDTTAIDSWGVDEDGCLWIKAPQAAFVEISSCADALAG